MCCVILFSHEILPSSFIEPFNFHGKTQMNETIETIKSVIASTEISNDYGWILLTGKNNRDLRKAALDSVRESVPDDVHVEE